MERGKDELSYEIESKNLKRCLEILKNASSDNDKFAALLLVTKAVKASDCSTADRKQLLEAVGMPFLSRLLKTRSVPEGCPPSMYKSVALSVLCSLCEDPQLACHPEMRKQVSVFNEILLETASSHEDDEMLKQIRADCYALLFRMATTPAGCQYLIQGGCPTALVTIIISSPADENKAMGVLLLLLRRCSQAVWADNLVPLKQMLAHLSKQIILRQDVGKFAMCDILAFFLSVTPKCTEPLSKQSWIMPLVTTVASMVKSKLGEAQRHSVLMLVSELVEFIGVPCLLPPLVADHKLLLLVTHLASIEVRLATENSFAEQLRSKVGKLVSYYSLLENIIHFLLTNDTFALQAKELQQIHVALQGALRGVLYLLSQIACGSMSVKVLDPIVQSSVRILGAWLAEETLALRTEVMELLPFIINMCKLEVGLVSEDNNLTDVPMIEDTCILPVAQPNQEARTSQEAEEMEIISMQASQAPIKSNSKVRALGPSGVHSAGFDCFNHNNPDESDEDERFSSDIGCLPSAQAGVSSFDADSECKAQDPSRLPEIEKSATRIMGGNIDPNITGLAEDFADLLTVQNEYAVGGGFSKSEWAELDVLRFLMPGFLHLTVDDDSRSILVKYGAPETFLQYFNILHERLVNSPDMENLKDQMSTLCNTFLNFVVTDANLCSTDTVFHELLDKISNILPTIVYDSRLILYSCHLTTLGLMLTRVQAPYFKVDAEKRKKFLAACVTFLSRAHVVQEQHQRTITVTLSEDYQKHWCQMRDLWVISVQELTVIKEHFPEIIEIILRSGYLPILCKIFVDVEAVGLDPDMKPVVLTFICKLAVTDPRVRAVLCQHRGLELARIHQLSDLEECLKTHL